MADLITRQAAIDVLDRNHILGQGLLNDTLDHIADAIMTLPSAQPDSKELSFTQKKLDTISRQAAIRWVKTECNPYGKPTLDFESGKKVIEHLKQMPSAQPETHEERTETHACDCISRHAVIEAINKIFPADPMRDDYTQGITCGAALANIYVAQLPSAQPEQLTDKEKRIFLAAMGREEKVCKQVDDECRNCREPYEDSLVRTCHEITRKVKGALWMI